MQMNAVDIPPVLFEWDMRKPFDIDDNEWRKVQLTRYIERFPSDKPKSVIAWIRSQSPNPWPNCTTKDISRIAISIKKSWSAAKREYHMWNHVIPAGTSAKE